MEKEQTILGKALMWLKYAGIAAIVIGILFLIRKLSLEFSGVRWTLFVIFYLLMSSMVKDCTFKTLAVLIEVIVNYIVVGFLFGYGNINAFIASHWILVPLFLVFALAVGIYADLHPELAEKE